MQRINMGDELWKKVERKRINSETLVGHFKSQRQRKERKDDYEHKFRRQEIRWSKVHGLQYLITARREVGKPTLSGAGLKTPW